MLVAEHIKLSVFGGVGRGARDGNEQLVTLAQAAVEDEVEELVGDKHWADVGLPRL